MRFDRQQFLDDLRLLASMDVPWKHRGNLEHPELGLDCAFSPRWAFERQGLNLPDELAREFDHYHRPPDGQRLLVIFRKWFAEIQREQLTASDLMVIYVRKNPCHIAVQMEGNEIAEAYESMDGSISRFLIRALDPRYRIAACFRIPDELQA